MSEKRWSIRDDNFHKIKTTNMNIFNMLLYTSEQAEYEKSDFYRNLCKRLYEEGQLQVKWYLQLANKYKTDSYIEKFKIVNYVFSNGFEHFINVTKKYGNTINGVRVVSRSSFTDRFESYTDYRYMKNRQRVRFDNARIGTRFMDLTQKTEENDYTR